MHAPSNFIFWHLFGLWCVNAAPFLPRSILPPRPSQPPTLARLRRTRTLRGARGCARRALRRRRARTRTRRADRCGDGGGGRRTWPNACPASLHILLHEWCNAVHQQLPLSRFRLLARHPPHTSRSRAARRCRQGLFTPRGAPGCAAPQHDSVNKILYVSGRGAAASFGVRLLLLQGGAAD